MKKIFFLATAGIMLFSFVVKAVAVSNNQVGQEIREEIRERTREEIQEKRISGTPFPKLLRIENRILERIREKFPFLLPAGVNKATITEISGTTLPTTIKVIKESKNITLNITDKTVILRKFGGKSNLSELHVGDIVSARGIWMQVEGSEETILDTRVLRDISIQKRKGTFWGSIESVGDNSFVLLTARRGRQTVRVSSTAKIINRRAQIITFADLKAGHRVRVSGVWDSTLNLIEEVTTIKDWSIPVFPKPSLTPEAAVTSQPTIKID